MFGKFYNFFFSFPFFPSLSSPLFSLIFPSPPPHASNREAHETEKTRAAPPPPPQWCLSMLQGSTCLLLLSPYPSVPLPVSSHNRLWSLSSTMNAPMENLNQALFSSWDNRTDAHDIPLAIPVSILSEINSNLRISRDFIFLINWDFISNSNFNKSGLLPHPI
jgi:hypothetical protein